MFGLSRKNPELSFDDVSILHEEDGREKWRIRWADVRRIAYVTEDTSPVVTDDQFLAVENPEQIHLISIGVPGFFEVQEELRRRFPFTMGPKDSLNNSVANDSVIVWPAAEAGLDLYETSARERCVTKVPITRVLNR